MAYKQDNLDNWDAFTSSWLGTDHVKGDTQPFVVINVSVSDQNENLKPRLTLESDQEQYDFDLNVTNSNFCKSQGVRSPKMLIGKKIYFKKVEVTSPKTKMPVQSLRIWKIE